MRRVKHDEVGLPVTIRRYPSSGRACRPLTRNFKQFEELRARKISGSRLSRFPVILIVLSRTQTRPINWWRKFAWGI